MTLRIHTMGILLAACTANSSPTTAQDSEPPVIFPNVKTLPRGIDQPQFSPPKTVEDAVQQAKRAISNVDLTDALFSPDRLTAVVTFLDEAIDIFAADPDRHQLYALRADARRFSDSEQKAAIKDLTVAISLAPENADYLVSRSSTWRPEDVDKAIADATQALQLSPQDARIVRRLANALATDERTNEALGMLTYAAMLHPKDGHISSSLVAALRVNKRYEAALRESDRGLKLEDISPLTYINRSAIFEELERYGDAVHTLESAREIWPESERLVTDLKKSRQAFLTNIPIFRGIAPMASHVKLQRLERLREKDPNPLLQFQQGVLLCELGMWKSALLDFEAVEELLPDFEDNILFAMRVRRLLESMREPSGKDNAAIKSLTPDRQIFEAIKAGNSKPLLQQMPRKLLPFIDQKELQLRIQRLARHWPPLSEAKISEAESNDHPDVGKRQRTLVLRFPNENGRTCLAELTLARTTSGKLIGFEFASERMKTGSLTALQKVEPIRECTSSVIDAVRHGDGESFSKLLQKYKAAFAPNQLPEILESIKELIGDIDHVEYLDTVIELPEYTENAASVLISGIALCHKPDGRLCLFQVRFAVDETLEIGHITVGNTINLHYSTSLKPKDSQLAAAHSSSNINDFYKLVHPSQQDDFGDRELRQLLHTATGEITGKLERLIEDSGSSFVRIESGEITRTSSFDAKYENAVTRCDADWSYGTLDDSTRSNSYDLAEKFGRKLIGEWLVPTAERDFRAYVEGSAESALVMLQKYRGFEQKKVESLAPMIRTLEGQYGKLLSIKFRNAVFDNDRLRWKLLFDLSFEKKEDALGNVEYTFFGALPNLRKIGFE